MNIFKRRYEITSFLVNGQKKLGLYSLLNLMQDTAWMHASSIGFGYKESLAKKVFWVLTRQKLNMQAWPDWEDEIEIHTWIRPLQRSFANRDFEIFKDGKKIGESVTSWALLDGETRKPTTIEFETMKEIVRTDSNLTLETAKIKPRSDLVRAAEFSVRNSDLDLNEHVNNTKYAQWILDSIPAEKSSQFILESYEINFLAETRSGDVVEIQRQSLENPQTDSAQFQGFRTADQKTVFVARLQIRPRN